ncbi:insulin-like 5b [Sinocyclocheilus anshuiensis]|uniref:Relaxin-3-like n=1 Tax=Sinocyclocheilus anshuiensis TaxID=1608454 RepID=A0A671KEJ7_9TELE|nr:PREDICTED: relaxin-3-like [Sinocyclocheilus anshuiensis]
MKVVLLVVLVVLVAWADSTQAQKALRLCGREFFRAVVYTCGASRWRRGQAEDPLNDYEIETDVESEMDRVRREAYEALPSTCCKVGCRKSDLVRMC